MTERSKIHKLSSVLFLSLMELNKNSFSSWYKLQSYFNVVNHAVNVAVAVFMTIYILREGKDSFAWHVYLTTIGYQLLMAEAIMVFYSPNAFSYFHSHRTKKHIHWILQLLATACIVAGNCVIFVIKTTPRFKSIHAVTGEA